MKKLLHIIAAPRGLDSNTLKVSQAFLEVFKADYGQAIHKQCCVKIYKA